MRGVTAYYLDKNKQYVKISANKYKQGDIITSQFLTVQGLMF